MPNFAALRAAVFQLFTKNLRGADIRPPSVRGLGQIFNMTFKGQTIVHSTRLEKRNTIGTSCGLTCAAVFPVCWRPLPADSVAHARPGRLGDSRPGEGRLSSGCVHGADRVQKYICSEARTTGDEDEIVNSLRAA